MSRRLDALLREGWLRAVDHALARSLARLRPDTDEAVLLGAAFASRALEFGHGLLRLDGIDALCAEIAPERPAPELPSARPWREALSASSWVQAGSAADALRPLVLEGLNLSLRRYHAHEVALASALRRRASDATGTALPAPAPERLQALFPALRDDPGDAQAAAGCALLRGRLLLLTGGPGTGKTTTVARALLLCAEAWRQVHARALRVALIAPTGKAAARLGEALREALAAVGALPGLMQVDVATVHRLLGLHAGGGEVRHDAHRPLPHDVVVLDEASMVDLPLMRRLVDAVADPARLLLVGDRDQLPSVDTGDVLAALCDAADAGGPLAPRRVALHRRWRQTEQGGLVPLADAVRSGDAHAARAALAPGRWPDLHWHVAQTAAPGVEALAPARAAYAAIQTAASPADALALARCLRVLTARREGPCGSLALNAGFARTLQPTGESETPFHGMPLIIVRNSPRHGLFNGDIGIAWREPGAALRVWFEGEQGLRAWLPAALPAHEPAWALTVHKAQGSEFDEVLLVLPPAASGASRALSRELLYTGVTRCRRRLVLWSDAAALDAAVARRAQRWSGLAARLSQGSHDAPAARAE